ncbi:Nucleic acid-binding, OB-fold [Sesbania bispinosa]|nr:Nucleic acid-binding, OB-fold [Sesbania bispinosa]
MASDSYDCHMLKDIIPGFDKWKIKARVNRMWGVPDPVSFGFLTVELVLVDAQGCKIQATITREFIRVFQSNIVEDRIYYFKYLSVVPNIGTYKPTKHMYKLLFQRRTQVVDAATEFSRTFGLTPMNNWQLVNYKGYFEHLVDFVGVVSAVSSEKDCVHAGVMRKYISMEITDHTGKIEFTLFDEYVPYVKEFLRCFGRVKPIFVVQYARIVPAAGQLFGLLLNISCS